MTTCNVNNKRKALPLFVPLDGIADDSRWWLEVCEHVG